VPDYVEISSTRLTRIDRLRSRSEDDRDAKRLRQRRHLIDDLTLEMNRARQAEITQEILEVVPEPKGSLASPRLETTCQLPNNARGRAAPGSRDRQHRPDRGDPGRRGRGRLPRPPARDTTTRSRFADPQSPGPRRTSTSPRPRTIPDLRGPAAPRRRPAVRAVAMDSTDGLSRGTEVIDTGSPITVPVGRATLGRIFNLLGERST